MTEQDAIARALALPFWQAPEAAEAIGGGLSNQNIRVRDGGRDFVVRLGGDIPVHGILRWHDVMVSEAAHKAGLSPELCYHEPDAMVLAYIDATTYGEEDVRDPANLARIVDLVRRCHRDVPDHLPGRVLAFWVFHAIRNYAALLRTDGSRHVGALQDLLETSAGLEAAVGPVEIVLCHNDLLAANFLDDGARLWLIDWEYGGFNSPLFDLGNLATNNGFSETEERALLETYFAEPAEPRWRSYQAMKCASLLREAMWSMVSEIHSDLDVDYVAYTAENMARFDAALADFRNT